MAIIKQYTDFDINFNKNEFTNDVSIKLNDNSIRQSVMNIILTKPGEKPFRRGFGVGIHKFLFENIITGLDRAKFSRDVQLQLEAHEPRVRFDKIKWDDSNVDTNYLQLEVYFFILRGRESQPQPDSLKIELMKVR